MTKAWPRVKLADCVDLLAGYPFKSDRFTDRADDIPLVKGENVGQGFIDWGIAKRWSSADWSVLERFQLRVGDVIVAMDRPWIPAGLKWAHVRERDPKSLLVQRCARLRPKDAALDRTFLRFVIGGPGFESYVRPITTGVNVPHISGKQILDHEFVLPPIDVQRRIADILGAYDELIENCQRRIHILEDMARGLYREWFVHFRFPGADALTRVDSPLGPVPQGFRFAKVGEVAIVNRKQIDASDKLDEIDYIDIASVSPGRIDTTTRFSCADAPSRARRVVQHGDVLWSCVRPNRRSYAAVMRPLPSMVASTGFAVLTARSVPYPYLYFATTTDQFVAYLSNRATGAAYPAVNARVFEDADVLLPPGSLVTRFSEVVEAMMENIHLLCERIANLRRTRDLLLPRLLSGQITLPEAEELAAP